MIPSTHPAQVAPIVAPRVRRARSGFDRYLRAALLIGVAVMSAACFQRPPKSYQADAITAWVVDADTGAPLSGVSVVAGWEVKGGLEGGNVVGWVKVLEAVTDESGKFTFPAWGPVLWTKGGAVRSGSPLLILFKSGYDFQLLWQRKRSPTENAPLHMSSDWDGQQIKLPRFVGTPSEYAERISSLDNQVDSLLANDQCNWKAIPKFLWSLNLQNEIFLAQQTPRHLRRLDYLSERYGRNCGSLKNFVQEHGK